MSSSSAPLGTMEPEVTKALATPADDNGGIVLSPPRKSRRGRRQEKLEAAAEHPLMTSANPGHGYIAVADLQDALNKLTHFQPVATEAQLQLQTVSQRAEDAEATVLELRMELAEANSSALRESSSSMVKDYASHELFSATTEKYEEQVAALGRQLCLEKDLATAQLEVAQKKNGELLTELSLTERIATLKQEKLVEQVSEIKELRDKLQELHLLSEI